MSAKKATISELGQEEREGTGAVRRFKIEDERNTWIVELSPVGKCDPYFKIVGFSSYKIYLTNFVESDIKGKNSTRTSGEFKYNLMTDSGNWETKRINNLITYVKSLLGPKGWIK